jgi:hypothetical protein
LLGAALHSIERLKVKMKKILYASVLVLAGCASGPSQNKLAESNNALRVGNATAALAILEDANKDIKQKDLPYYLDKGTLLRLSGADAKKSVIEHKKVDASVDDWVANATSSLSKNSNEFFSYAFASSSKNVYELKGYEKSLLGFDLALSEFFTGDFDAARVQAKKLSEREKLIEKINEKKLSAVREKVEAESKKNPQVTSKPDSIGGYPVNLYDLPEVKALKNAYQNAAAHYLAGFMFEMQGESGMAAPGYRLALELRPDSEVFSSSLANLDRKITENNSAKKTSEVLVVYETGTVPRISSFKANQTFMTAKGPKIVTITLPKIEPQSVPPFVPTGMAVGAQSVRLSQAVSVDSLARRQLRDDMPGYVAQATTQAIVQLIAQQAAQAAFEQKNQNMGMLAGLVTGLALSVGDADVRMWTALPSHIYMGRVEVPKGKNTVTIPTPLGPQSFEIDATQNYHVVHVRLLGNKAVLRSS